MVETTERLLATLSALQGGTTLSGPELASRLGVTARTVRRDVDRLRQLGYAVESELGVAGGYRLGSGGSAVPPLLLDDDEAVALAVCARAAAGGSVAGAGEAATRALGKLEQGMPARLRARIAAIVQATERLPDPGAEVDHGILVTITTACREGQELAVTYRRANGPAGGSERRLEPHRVVSAGRRWYLVARDRRRGEWRTYRLDRVVDARPTGHGVDVSDAPDAAAFVGNAITTAPYRHRARVDLDAPVATLAALIPSTVGVLEALDETTTRLTVGVDDLDLLVVRLGCLGVPFRVLEPADLVDRLAVVAEHLAAIAAASAASSATAPLTG
jgi:predicted DNA-binding transcriptional regulator YafY